MNEGEQWSLAKRGDASVIREAAPDDARTSSDAPRDVVQEASEASFPASDPPSWAPLHPGPPATHRDSEPR
jgi:hypothetical protein